MRQGHDSPGDGKSRNAPPAMPQVPAAQRAIVKLALKFQHDSASLRTCIATFYQEGCLKARLPRPVRAGICDAVMMNISGGIAGGDALSVAIDLAAGAQACVAGQAAERVYRSAGAEPARLQTVIHVGAGATLHYLPQETILFDGFALARSLEIELATDAHYLGVESLVFGRQAMGEFVRSGHLRDRVSLRRGGKLIFQDMIRLDGDIQAVLARKAVANGAAAVASMIYACENAAARLDAVRAAVQDQGCEAGATMLEGLLLVRLLAPSSARLRTGLNAALHICREGRALPRVWQG